jgi:phage terminase large subunit-like protein
MDKWDVCAFPVSEDNLEGRVCYGGLDLSSTTDITAFVLVLPPIDEVNKCYDLPYSIQRSKCSWQLGGSERFLYL